MNKEMINLFFKLTSTKVQIRKETLGREKIVLINNKIFRIKDYPLWRKNINTEEHIIWKYSVLPWIPFRATTDLINHYIHVVRENKLKYLERETLKGLAVAMREGSSRIIELKLSLKDAIVYSYLTDIRFVILTCLLMGLSLWWMDVPELLFQKTVAFQSLDLGLIVRVTKDVYVHNICATHAVPIPCDCGEPLNRTCRDIFSSDNFDPLHIDKYPTKRAIAYHVATIIISLALAESVSTAGVMVA